MNKPLRPLNPDIRQLLLGLCLGGTLLQAQAASCPADTFEEFVQAYSSQPETRQAHTQLPLKLRTAVLQQSEVRIEESISKAPWTMLDKALTLESATLQAKRPDTAVISDPDGKVLRILGFSQQPCWTLIRLEDWSLGTMDDKADKTPGASAYQRGERYKELAMQERSNSQVQLYEAALASYLAGTREGSAKAAYLAAGISLSGQAPKLSTPHMQNLLETAAKTIPEAGITLAYFYCDEGESGSDLPCAKPDKALQALKDIARLDLKIALVELGNAYATGEIVAQDSSHALACYLEAQTLGATGLDSAIANLKAKGGAAQRSDHCF
ncbi:sel1 repeat family protein [Pseudomonas sp. R-28-1W-6]|uniref:sel1 repeat family protein n=1 Tax=Pseudomonas sp. R-28-1W-6 TaxID=2650101 RepID=UPI001366435A|nr:sel1 repeat family protein [Pseudomonas sp. R-28-1W-6]MWV10837.1 sel1 repeat family protein [Pseudomonas sp. R-28-1W-6]